MVLLISIPVTLIVIGPLAMLLSQMIAKGILSVYGLSPTLISALLGGLWIPMVAVGLHGAIVPIALTNFFTNGYDVIFPMITGHSFAIAGAIVAMGMKIPTKSKKDLLIPPDLTRGLWESLNQPCMASCLLRERF